MGQKINKTSIKMSVRGRECRERKREGGGKKRRKDRIESRSHLSCVGVPPETAQLWGAVISGHMVCVNCEIARPH